MYHLLANCIRKYLVHHVENSSRQKEVGICDLGRWIANMPIQRRCCSHLGCKIRLSSVAAQVSSLDEMLAVLPGCLLPTVTENGPRVLILGMIKPTMMLLRLWICITKLYVLECDRPSVCCFGIEILVLYMDVPFQWSLIRCEWLIANLQALIFQSLILASKKTWTLGAHANYVSQWMYRSNDRLLLEKRLIAYTRKIFSSSL